MSEISKRLRAYVNDPTVSDNYGAWGALRPDQRRQIRKLCDTCDRYEQAADSMQGTIVKLAAEIEKSALPCKIGDTVYAISNYAGVKKIRSGKVSQMFYVGEEMQLCIVVSKVGRGTWGKSVFATEEEAQAAINERKRG